VIAPGLGISADALFAKAARLHQVSVRRPSRVIGRHTEQSLQSGLFHGYAALVRGLVERIRQELGLQAPVVATGGLAPVFEGELEFLEAVDVHLTLEGLRLVWDKNRR
jgi:type III pantothenate kinase